MTRFFFSFCLLLLMGSAGCRPAPPSAPPSAPPDAAASSGPEAAVQPPEPSDRSAPSNPAPSPAPKYSAEQMAAAKQLAADLAMVIREDAAGNVILMDTAAKRSWVDDLTIFQCANITDQGLNVLAAYDRMRRLTLRDVAARAAALEQLPQPERLVALNLEQSGITDDEVPVLARFSKLESLNLGQTRLTDKAIEALATLNWLKDLTLTQTNITEQGVQRLREALPDVSIRFQ